jgi:hypothetical protein
MKSALPLWGFRAMPEPLLIISKACIGAMIGFVSMLIRPEPFASVNDDELVIGLPGERFASAQASSLASLRTVRRPLAQPRLRLCDIFGSDPATTRPNWYLTIQQGWNHGLAWLARSASQVRSARCLCSLCGP